MLFGSLPLEYQRPKVFVCVPCLRCYICVTPGLSLEEIEQFFKKQQRTRSSSIDGMGRVPDGETICI
jgi:hypothetical protein